ncbi:VIT family protein [Pseudomonas veronii]|jgi:VIT1/CCC1 family predicted Fe2+/Mn2+ transporter|uniref:VIT family protein n=1 Tax=Pseudomonas veronii TaxID=76761 RepID=A0A4P7YCA2_PSEVE|nr:MULTISPECIES: VIT family protein [Pseudomonas]MBI6555084.1 VIT family protein [Pseudomonas veronii]MBI6648109.1 VIT family protein [Pseudomonas veronii]MDY7554036.1 VIT family protein [Pseudomonas sp. FG1]MEB0050748.1 VIT family protein [Pseudomonas sp. FG1]NMY12705.1 VIT family protein [Pseudomonas veronii]
MKFMHRHTESHRSDRIGWLRAAVLGANDGIVSTASLLIGVAAANASHASLIVTGMAGLVAGAMSMAAGEYVSVHSQADTEHADLARERAELASNPKAEHSELANIYMQRGVSPELAHQVADQLMAHDALGAHARDELGISEALAAKPLQAALASAASFVVGAALPLAVTLIAPEHSVVPWICGMSLLFLASLGAVAARAGGAKVFVGAWRVTLWGVLAMGITASVGALFGAVV